MVQEETLEQLFADRWELTDRIIDLSSQSGAEKEKIRRLVSQRDRVNATIREVIDAEFVASSSPALKKAIAELGAESKTLKELQTTIDSVDQVIDVAARVVELAVTIIGLAAA